MLGRIPDEPKDETAPSIVGEERPDPGADPTTLIGRIPESPKPRPGKSMLHAERPPDETEDDTRMLIPKQRDDQDRAPVEEK